MCFSVGVICLKSHTYSLLFFIVIALLPLSILRADECSTLTATGNAEYPPYLWRDPKGGKQLLGANQYVVDEVAKRLGVVIELKDVGSWARAQEALKRGEVDLLAGAFYTDSRRHYMDYIYPAFFNTTSVVWSKPGVSDRYHAREDLIGLKGVTVIDNSFGQEFDEYIKAKLDLTYVPSLKQAFLMLSRDRADYILYEKNPGLVYAELLGYKGRFDILAPEVSAESLYLTISRQSKCNTPMFRERLAKTIRDMQADGFMDKALIQGFESWRL